MSAHRWIRPSLRRLLLAGVVPRWVQNHPRRPYVIGAVLATPPWVDRKALMALVAKRDAKRTPHVLDHIIPLNHPRVCGLNVPWNIKVVPAGTNQAKSNAWCEWHGELFTDPEQFSLF